MLQRELTREQVNHLGEQILSYMENHIIERGYEYFSRGMVFNIHVQEGSLITSEVQGSQVYQVEIDLNLFSNSTCTCPFSRFCKHQAATFFQICSVFQSPKNFLQIVKQPRTVKFSPSMLYPAPQKHAKEQPNSQSLFLGESTITEKSTVTQWWLFLENWSLTLSSDMEKHGISSELRINYQNVLLVTRTWPEELAQLFTIHANLFHLLKLQEYTTEKALSSSSYWFRELRETADRLVEQLEGTLFYLDATNLWEHHRAYLEDTLPKVKELKNFESQTINWILVYRLLWWDLLNNPSWVQKEVKELEQCLDDPSLSTTAKGRYQLLKTHFSVMEGQDEVALREWSQSNHLSLPFYLFYFKALARRNEWQRLLTWLDCLERMIKEAEGHEYRLIAGLWRQALEKIGRLEEWEAILKRFLPTSYHEYSSYLFDQNQFKQWLDLQMSYRVSVLEIHSLQIKPIEAFDPTLLLPFYVREINRMIGERNRSSYKNAIKLLKRLRTCYNNAKQDDRWEQFIHQLAAKHNRLRAFQEELRRGNLIS